LRVLGQWLHRRFFSASLRFDPVPYGGYGHSNSSFRYAGLDWNWDRRPHYRHKHSHCLLPQGQYYGRIRRDHGDEWLFLQCQITGGRPNDRRLDLDVPVLTYRTPSWTPSHWDLLPCPLLHLQPHWPTLPSRLNA